MSFLDELESIEKSLETGEDVRKDFWKLVGKVKRERVTNDEVLKRIAMIRDRMFRKKLILSYRAGAVLFSTMFLLFNVLFFMTATLMSPGTVKAGLILTLELTVMYFAFLLGRCAAASLLGIKVDGFYRYMPFEFGVKINYLSYLKARQRDRVLLYAGAIVLEHITMLAHTLFLLAIKSSYWVIPAFFLVVNLPFSYAIHRMAKTGELHRLLREYRILKELKTKSN